MARGYSVTRRYMRTQGLDGAYTYHDPGAYAAITGKPAYIQKTFCSVDYGFRWTSDGWYEFDGAAAKTACQAAAKAYAKELKGQGWAKVTCKRSRPDALISKGGIGSGYPHIELVVPCWEVFATR